METLGWIFAIERTTSKSDKISPLWFPHRLYRRRKQFSDPVRLHFLSTSPVRELHDSGLCFDYYLCHRPVSITRHKYFHSKNPHIRIFTSDASRTVLYGGHLGSKDSIRIH